MAAIDSEVFPALGSNVTVPTKPFLDGEASIEKSSPKKEKAPARDSSEAIGEYMKEAINAANSAIECLGPKNSTDEDDHVARVHGLEDFIRRPGVVKTFQRHNIHYGIQRGAYTKREALWHIEMPFVVLQKKYMELGYYLYEVTSEEKCRQPIILISRFPPSAEIQCAEMWHGYNKMPIPDGLMPPPEL
jgi:hypothetical protein